MKHIKSYKIFESQEHPDFPTTEKEVHDICKKYKIEDYTINDDLSINVQTSVSLYNKSLIYLPLKFNMIEGFFNCSSNKLKSLKGAPHIVSGFFDCHDNNLKSLKESPNEVGGAFYCSSNKLETLKGAPHKVGGIFSCYNNNIMSLKYLPNYINYKYTEFYNNPIHSVVNTFIEEYNAEDLVKEFNDYDIVRGDKVVLSRLKVFYSDFDLKMPDLDEVKKYYKII